MSIPLRPLLIAVLCLAWLLPGLVAHDPWKPDEAYTFGVVFEILQGGSWVVPQIAGEPFLDKPPLFHLSAAASALLLSPLLPLHDGARLAAGLWVALALLFCALTSRELHGPRHGLTAALLLLGCFGLVVRGHQLISDTAALAGFAMAYYGFALALRRAGPGALWIGTGCGIVFMTLGIAEAAIVVILALLLPVNRSWRTPRHAAALLAATAIALPWLSIWPLLLLQHDAALFEVWLHAENFLRISAPGELLPGLMYYLRILPWYAFPVWPLALWALWRLHGRSQLASSPVVLCIMGFTITLAVLAASAEPRELRALPLLLPIALLAVPGVDTMRRGAANGWIWFSIMAFTFFIAVGWFYWTALELGYPARLHGHLHAIRPGYDFGFRLLPFLLGLFYTAGWFALITRLPRSPEKPLVIWAGGITAVWALLATLFIGWVDTTKSYRSMISDMSRALPAQYRCIASRELGESPRAMLHYFSGIRTQRAETRPQAAHCDLLLVQGRPLDDIVMPTGWQKIWEGHRPGDKDERFRLYRTTARDAKQP